MFKILKTIRDIAKKHGLGMGLPGVKRFTGEMAIDSLVKKGHSK
ncbi:hypothetical protein ACFL6K_05585 [Candidatus Latescibacterota bacterium]